MSPVIPPKDANDEVAQATIGTTVGRVTEMDLIAEMEGRSRNEIANYLWEWGLAQHWREKGVARPEDPSRALQKHLGPKRWAERQDKRKRKP